MRASIQPGPWSHSSRGNFLAMLIAMTVGTQALAGARMENDNALTIEASPTAPMPLEAAPVPSSLLEMEPFKPPVLQRLDAGDEQVRSDIAALTHIADSPEVRTQIQSKRRPKNASASLNAANAAWTLGLIYLHGAGIGQDSAQAQWWFERAQQLGAKQAYAGLVWCAIEGCAGLPSPGKADRWLTPLRGVNRPLALYLEWLAQDRLAPLRTAQPELNPNSDRPAPFTEPQLLLSAASAGNVHALIELGMAAAEAQRPDKALQYFRRAADRSAIAAANAALVAQSMQPKEAPKHDDNKASLELLIQAQRFHRGEGVSVNYAEAIRYYRLAAAKGSVEAERMLALIYSRPLVRGTVDVAWVGQLGELNLAQSTPSVRVKSAPRQLQRERTALVDLLPAKWRARIL